jgi:O-antigen/teichoic acid export membrane protein
MAINKKKIVGNALSAYTALFLKIIIFIVLTPYIIHSIGIDNFGLYTLAFSTLGLFTLLDLGFQTGTVKFSAQCKGDGNLDKRNQVLSTIFVFYIFLSIIAFAGVLILSFFFTEMFDISTSQQTIALILLWIIAARVVIIRLPLNIYKSVLFAEQNISLLNFIGIFSIIVYALSVWCIFSLGLGVIALAWINLAAMLLENFIMMFFAYKKIDKLKVSIRLFDLSVLKEVFSFSAFAFLSNIAALILLKTDPIIIKFFLPISAVAIYAIALKITQQAILLPKQCINVLTPLIAELKGQEDESKIRDVMLWGTKIILAPSLMLCIALIALASEILTCWVGKEFAAAAPSLILLICATIITVPQMMASNILTMSGFHKFTGTLSIISAIINVVLSISFVYSLGITGIALGTFLTTVIIDFTLIAKACRMYKITLVKYFKGIILPVFFPSVIQLILTLWLKSVLPPTNLIYTMLLAVPGTIVFSLIYWFLCLKSEDREKILKLFLKRKKAANSKV